MITVFGRLLASFFDAQAGPVPVTGRVLFTPNFTSEQSAEGVHLPTRLSVKLDDEGSFEASLLTGDWSWRVEVIAKDQTERTLTVPCFNFLPEPGVDRVNLADIVPITDPVTAQPMLRGEDGVGVGAITTDGGELVFTLTNGTESRIPVPQGIPGTGVDNITLQGDELVFTLSDGSETRLPAPEGTPGDEGVGISAITLVDGELVFTLTNGSESRLPAPKGDPGAPGEPGDPGVSPPAPTLSVGNVETLPNGSTATAAITGDTPNYTLALGIPQGAPGAKGDTPNITAGTVNTLPAGAPATAAMVPTAGGYTLNLGLPAGASGANGKDAATPTLAVGTVSTGTAAASITGTAPNYTLNLTLPTPPVRDTGWREITSYFTLNQNGLGNTGKFYVRRVGDTVSLATHDVRVTTSVFSAPLSTPIQGFNLSAPGNEGRYALGVMSFLYTDPVDSVTYLRCSGYAGNNTIANFRDYSYLTTDPWPATLPGVAV